MKQVVLQLVCLLGLILLTGTAYNMATGKLEFFVKPNRYPNALVCRKSDESPKPEEPGKAPAPSEPESPTRAPSKPEATSGQTVEESPPQKQGAESPATAGGPAAGRMPEIGYDDAVELWRDGILFIDARTTKRYRAGHIPGAVSIGAWEPGIEEKVERLAENEPVAAPVVVYCTKSQDCEDSHIVGSHLKEFGFLEVLVYSGGFPGWLEKKMPVAEGEEPGPRGPEEPGEGGEGGTEQ